MNDGWRTGRGPLGALGFEGAADAVAGGIADDDVPFVLGGVGVGFNQLHLRFLRVVRPLRP
jgi:hypothetical protein